MANRASYAAILAVLISSQVAAQEQQSQTAKITGMVVMEGPYELNGGGGILGFILKRTGTLVDFQPCSGPVQSIEENRLIKTQLDCSDEPPLDTHPVTASCDFISQVVTKFFDEANATPAMDPLGTKYYLPTSQVAATKTLPSSTDIWTEWAAAAGSKIKDCGNRYIYFTGMETRGAWVGYVKEPTPPKTP